MRSLAEALPLTALLLLASIQIQVHKAAPLDSETHIIRTYSEQRTLKDTWGDTNTRSPDSAEYLESNYNLKTAKTTVVPYTKPGYPKRPHRQPAAYMSWDMIADEPVEELRRETAEKEAKRAKKRKKNRKNKEGKVLCDSTTQDELMEMLGPAFNGRYMSVEKPIEEMPQLEEAYSGTNVEMLGDSIGPTAARILPFKVDPNYKRELPTNFYKDISWYMDNMDQLPNSVTKLLRHIRSVPQEDSQLPWQCDSEIFWTDLGANYYPRFLRNIRCTRENCWFGHFKCRPKAFTVNVLKRVSDGCVEGTNNKYVEEWSYEERAVTFCCECVEY